MVDQEILYKAIQKAESKGYTEHLAYLPIFTSNIKDSGDVAKFIFFSHKHEIMFSHSFAKAFFGNEDTIYSCNAWVRRLEEMSQEANEIRYLERFL
ncbi:MAG: hypothetical protein ACTSWD_12855 [Candidatus Heimdallarchaeota archaeon]